MLNIIIYYSINLVPKLDIFSEYKLYLKYNIFLLGLNFVVNNK